MLPVSPHRKTIDIDALAAELKSSDVNHSVTRDGDWVCLSLYFGDARFWVYPEGVVLFDADNARLSSNMFAVLDIIRKHVGGQNGRHE